MARELLGAKDAEEIAAEARMLGPYRLERELGRGGMGVVHLATDLRSGACCAVKSLPPVSLLSERRQRFRREIQVLARLDHPGIARLLEAGIATAGGPYLAMEHVADALPITAWARDRSPAPAERARVMAEVCEAMHHAHEQGVVHRDLKPANILVTVGDGAVAHPKVVDFGVAIVMELVPEMSATLTAEDHVIGTPAYMSPEQRVPASRRPRRIDARSDIYSLGIVLGELIDGEDARALRGLRAIATKATARRPSQRYPTALHMAEDLRRWIGGAPVLATPPGILSRLGEQAVRHPILASGAVAALLALVIVATAIVTAWIVIARPAAVEVDPVQRRWMRVLTAAGMPLATIDTRTDDGVRWAAVADTVAALRLILAGFDAESDEHAGSLIAWKDGALGRPLWTDRPSQADVPAGSGRLGPFSADGSFGFVFGDLGNFIDDRESAGDEILACFAHTPGSIACIRIYDGAGRRLREFWHDGQFSTWHWSDSRRMLVLAGVDGSATWSERGFPEGGRAFPIVVLGVEPNSFDSRPRWLEGLSTPDGAAIERGAAWSRCLLPPSVYPSLERMRLKLRESARSKADSFVTLTLIGAEGGGVRFEISADGAQLGAAVPTSAWVGSSSGSPAEAMRLGEAPGAPATVDAPASAPARP